jgi:hypothetical protein
LIQVGIGWIAVIQKIPSEDVQGYALSKRLSYKKLKVEYTRDGKAQLIEETILDEWEEK